MKKDKDKNFNSYSYRHTPISILLSRPMLIFLFGFAFVLGVLGCSASSVDEVDGFNEDEVKEADVQSGDFLTEVESGLTCYNHTPPDDWTYPEGPLSPGSQVGDLFSDFQLEDCEGNLIQFGDILANSELVLFNVSAGWCRSCVDETRTLEEEVFNNFCGRGLKIVQVLFQDEQARPATKLFCSQWRDTFGLTFPVLVDPLFITEKYLESSQTPLNLLIDKEGVIRYRTTGPVPGDFNSQIEDLL